MRKQLQPLRATSGGKVSVSAVRSVTGISLPVNIQLRGADVKQLAQFAEQVRDQIENHAGTARPGRVHPQRQAGSAGADGPGTRRAIQCASGAGGSHRARRHCGQHGRGFSGHRQGEEFPVRVRLADVDRDDPADVGNVVVGYDASGSSVALADVADIPTETGPSAI